MYQLDRTNTKYSTNLFRKFTIASKIVTEKTKDSRKPISGKFVIVELQRQFTSSY